MYVCYVCLFFSLPCMVNKDEYKDIHVGLIYVVSEHVSALEALRNAQLYKFSTN